MPRIKKATDANGAVFYPINISKAVWDTDRSQRLNVTLSAIQASVYPKVTGFEYNSSTGELVMVTDDGT